MSLSSLFSPGPFILSTFATVFDLTPDLSLHIQYAVSFHAFYVSPTYLFHLLSLAQTQTLPEVLVLSSLLCSHLCDLIFMHSLNSDFYMGDAKTLISILFPAPDFSFHLLASHFSSGWSTNISDSICPNYVPASTLFPNLCLRYYRLFSVSYFQRPRVCQILLILFLKNFGISLFSSSIAMVIIETFYPKLLSTYYVSDIMLRIQR